MLTQKKKSEVDSADASGTQSTDTEGAILNFK